RRASAGAGDRQRAPGRATAIHPRASNHHQQPTGRRVAQLSGSGPRTERDSEDTKMGQLATKIATYSVLDAPMSPAPIPEEDIISGSPESTMAILWQSEDNTLYNGVWHCTPGTFMLTHPGETICLVEGRVTITPEGGDPVTLGPGDLAYIPEGTVCRWEVE